MWLSWYKVNVFQFFETCSCLVFKPSKCMALKNQHANMKDMCLHAYITIYIYIHTWLCKSDKKPISFPWASGSRIELPACKVLSRVFERHLFDLNLYIYRFQNIVYIYIVPAFAVVWMSTYILKHVFYIYIYTFTVACHTETARNCKCTKIFLYGCHMETTYIYSLI